ncbi:MAG TPA: TolC family protein [Terriglobales bacterium]|nr:TolC family protein [Terriglobales bacterium]
MRNISRGARLPILFIFFFQVLSALLLAEPLSLRRAVELAVSHGEVVGVSKDDEQHAFATYLETKDQFVPQIAVGSGLGATWGFPLSLENAAPSILNVNAQSSLINPGLREFTRAAKTEWQATKIQSKDQRGQLVQDTVLTYLELSKWETLIDHLRQQQAEALKIENIVDQRIREGVDNPLERNQARLTTAQAHLRVTEAQGSIDVLRERLAQLTGLASASIVTEPESIPDLPETKTTEDDAPAKAVQISPLVQTAETHALAASFRARGEHRAMWPTVDFAAQYALLSTFNNYENYFRAGSFQRNNATLGVVIRFPFFSLSQHARVQGADADLIHAKKQVQITKNQVSVETLRLQRTVEQLQAAREVADISNQIAQSNLEAMKIRMEAGTATLHEAVDARIQTDERYDALQDADFQLQHARISLLRATGDLETWAETDK